MSTVFSIVNPLQNTAVTEYGTASVEGRAFLCPLVWSQGGADVTQIFSLEGDIPKGITIDPMTAVISGVFGSLEKQGFSGVPAPYPEYDFRALKGVSLRSEATSYEFNFKVVSTGTEIVGTATVPFRVEADLKLVLYKDWGVESALMIKAYLDGVGTRQGFTCFPNTPMTKEHCEIIGGVWKGYCDISVPTQAKCASLGGVWENGSCNLLLIDTEAQCTALGGSWKKNSLVRSDETFVCSISSITTQEQCEADGGIWEKIQEPPTTRTTFNDYKSSLNKDTLKIVNEFDEE